MIRFLHFARGSLKETRYWLKRAKRRSLITPQFFDQQMAELEQLAIEINGYIKFQRTRLFKESGPTYETN